MHVETRPQSLDEGVFENEGLGLAGGDREIETSCPREHRLRALRQIVRGRSRRGPAAGGRSPCRRRCPCPTDPGTDRPQASPGLPSRVRAGGAVSSPRHPTPARNFGFRISNFEFSITTPHPTSTIADSHRPCLCGNSGCSRGNVPRAAEVPFSTLLEAQTSRSAERHRPTTLKVAPPGYGVLRRGLRTNEPTPPEPDRAAPAPSGRPAAGHPAC